MLDADPRSVRRTYEAGAGSGDVPDLHRPVREEAGRREDLVRGGEVQFLHPVEQDDVHPQGPAGAGGAALRRVGGRSAAEPGHPRGRAGGTEGGRGPEQVPSVQTH